MTNAALSMVARPIPLHRLIWALLIAATATAMMPR